MLQDQIVIMQQFHRDVKVMWKHRTSMQWSETSIRTKDLTSILTSSLKISLKKKDVPLLDELAEFAGRFNGLHLLESFRDRAPVMSQALRCLKVGQLDFASVVANDANVSVALLVQSTTILGRLSNHTRANDDFAASFLERFSLAVDFFIRIFRFGAASWQLVVVSLWSTCQRNTTFRLCAHAYLS
jgi:hypothetical protein